MELDDHVGTSVAFTCSTSSMKTNMKWFAGRILRGHLALLSIFLIILILIVTLLIVLIVVRNSLGLLLDHSEQTEHSRFGQLRADDAAMRTRSVQPEHRAVT